MTTPPDTPQDLEAVAREVLRIPPGGDLRSRIAAALEAHGDAVRREERERCPTCGQREGRGAQAMSDYPECGCLPNHQEATINLPCPCKCHPENREEKECTAKPEKR